VEHKPDQFIHKTPNR